MNIISPIATGNGAYVVHQELSNNIHGYRVCGYNPYWTLCPPALPFLCRQQPKTKPNLIHTTPDYGFFFRRKGVPLVLTFHNFVLDKEAIKYGNFLQRVHYQTDLRFFTREAIQTAASVTAVSHFTADLVKNNLKYDGEIQVIYNGVDSEIFVPKPKLNKKRIKVLFSGNLTRRKGANLLPLIAEKLDNNIEILYTSGLRTKNNLPISPKLHNLGQIPYSAMPQVYQDADILLFPTVREGFGLAAVEAMACGLPVVATDCSSLPELIVHGEGGYLCQPGNVNQFVTRINELAASPNIRTEMGEFNRARVEKKFTAQRMVAEYKKLFGQLIRQRTKIRI